MELDKKADAKLTNLEVREVSIVDRPANQRKFLVVKNSDGNLSVIRTEKCMREAIPREAAEDLGYIFNDDDEDEIEIPELNSEPEDLFEDAFAGEGIEEDLEYLEKKAIVKDVFVAVKNALQKLMPIVQKLKSANGKDASRGIADQLKSVIAVLEKFKKSKSSDEKTKAKTNALDTCSSCLTKLMSSASTLKAMGPDEDVPGKVMDVLSEVVFALGNLLNELSAGEPPATQEEEMSAKHKAEVYVANTDEEDPEVIFKVGSKMKKTRLGMLKNAAALLFAVLKEISPKNGEDVDFQKKILDEINQLHSDMNKVSKRVEEIEAVRPAGSNEDPPVVVEKKSLWGNVLGT